MIKRNQSKTLETEDTKSKDLCFNYSISITDPMLMCSFYNNIDVDYA